MKKILLGTLVFALTLSMFHTYFQAEFPYTNDGENHLARFANYKIAIKEGQFPPRFAPNLMNHYGYPVFNFNYPLANILSLPLSALKLNPETSFKLISMTAFLFGLIGIYLMLREQKKSLFTIVIGMTLFGIQPYIANTVLFRGSIGELLALALLPWIFWSIHKLIEKPHLNFWAIAIWSTFLLSHNVTVLLSVPFIFIYAFFKLKGWENKQKLAYVFSYLGIAFATTSWFWLPALFEANQTIVTQVGIANQFFQHFPTLTQLLFGQLGFGFSYAGPIDSLSFQLGYASVFIILLSLVILIKLSFSKQKNGFTFLLPLGVIIFCIFLQLQWSTWLWSLLPQLQIIQFPWRLSILLCTFIPLLWAETSIYYSRFLKKVLILICCFCVYQIGQLEPVDFFHRTQLDYDLFAQSTSTQNENRTQEFNYIEIGDWQPRPKIMGLGEATVLDWTGTYRTYNLNLQTTSTIIEPTMNFSGWQTTVSSSNQPPTIARYVRGGDIQGRIAYELAPGQYQIHSRFTQQTAPRIIGNLISLLTGVLIFIFLLKEKIQHAHAKK